jgi:hypothetical protein
LEEEKATLERMIESHDELLMEIARETRLDRLGEDNKVQEEDEDAGDGEDAAAPHAATPTPSTPPVAAPEEIDDEGPVERIPEQEAPVPHEVILADAEPEMPQPRLYHTLMRDYEESPPRMMEDLDDQMMTQMKAALTWTSGFLKMEVMIEIESSSLSLKFWFKNKTIGFT